MAVYVQFFCLSVSGELKVKSEQVEALRKDLSAAFDKERKVMKTDHDMQVQHLQNQIAGQQKTINDQNALITDWRKTMEWERLIREGQVL